MSDNVIGLPAYRDGSSNRIKPGDLIEFTKIGWRVQRIIRDLTWPKSKRPQGDRHLSESEMSLMRAVLQEFLQFGEAQTYDDVYKQIARKQSQGLTLDTLRAIYDARQSGAFVQLHRRITANLLFELHRREGMSLSSGDLGPEHIWMRNLCVLFGAMMVRPTQWRKGVIVQEDGFRMDATA